LNKLNIVNGFFPHKNFGDDMFLACAEEYVKGEYKVRNSEKVNKNYFSWLLYILRNTKSYTWLGGTFIDKDTTLSMLTSMLIEFTFVKLSGAELKFVSVGLARDVGWLKKLAIKYICWLANSITVRDEESFAAYKNCNNEMFQTGDIVVLNSMRFHQNVTSIKKVDLFVSVDKKRSLDIFKSKIHLFKPCENTKAAVQITSPYQAEIQKQLSSEVCSILGCDYEVEPYESFDKVLELIASSEYVITDRLHVAIAGVINNKSVYLFGVSEKLRGINSLIDTRGLLKLVV